MTIAEALSARLTELMEEKHLTAYRLSMLTGVNQTTIVKEKTLRKKLKLFQKRSGLPPTSVVLLCVDRRCNL